MRIKQRLLATVLTLSVSSLAMVQAQAESLADAMAHAYEHSGLLEQNRALLRAADEDVAIAASALRPVLSWATNVQRSFGGGTTAIGSSAANSNNSANISLSMNWILDDSGSTKSRQAALQQTVLATRQTLVSVEQGVLLNAVQAFMDVRRFSEIVALRQNNLRLITRELRAAEDRFEVGEVTRTDVALAEARLAGARAELGVAQGDLLAAREAYAAFVGKKPGALVAPRGLPRTASTLEKARSIGVRNHPDLQSAQFSVAANELLITNARAAMRPTTSLSMSLNANEGLNNSGSTQSGSVTLGASGPIYQGGRLSAQVRQAMARRDAARGGLHATRHNVRQAVGAAWAQSLAARAQREASARQIRAARIAFEGVREEAKLGSRTTLDVLNAEQELLDAQANQITASSLELTAAYRLLSAMGLLTVDHLNLSVEKYDPEAYFNKVKSAPAITSKQGRQLDQLLRSIGKE